MTDVDEFIEHFFEEHGDDNILEHAEIKRRYDPVKARAYYLRTRKLKGRKAGQTISDPRSKIGYNGKPLKPLGTKMEEDETPETSPSGAKLKDFEGKGLGRATYADGSVYDAATGWSKGGAPAKSRGAQTKAAQDSVNRMRSTVMKMANGPSKTAALKRINAAQRRLNVAKRRAANAG